MTSILNASLTRSHPSCALLAWECHPHAVCRIYESWVDAGHLEPASVRCTYASRIICTFMEWKFFLLTYANLCSDGTFIAMCVQLRKPSFVSTCEGAGNVKILPVSLSKVGPNSAQSSKRTALGDLKRLTAVNIVGKKKKREKKIIVVPKNLFPYDSAKAGTVKGCQSNSVNESAIIFFSYSFLFSLFSNFSVALFPFSLSILKAVLMMSALSFTEFDFLVLHCDWSSARSHVHFTFSTSERECGKWRTNLC